MPAGNHSPRIKPQLRHLDRTDCPPPWHHLLVITLIFIIYLKFYILSNVIFTQQYFQFSSFFQKAQIVITAH